jgi:hypothetical protein
MKLMNVGIAVSAGLLCTLIFQMDEEANLFSTSIPGGTPATSSPNANSMKTLFKVLHTCDAKGRSQKLLSSLKSMVTGKTDDVQHAVAAVDGIKQLLSSFAANKPIYLSGLVKHAGSRALEKWTDGKNLIDVGLSAPKDASCLRCFIEHVRQQ